MLHHKSSHNELKQAVDPLGDLILSEGVQETYLHDERAQPAQLPERCRVEPCIPEQYEDSRQKCEEGEERSIAGLRLDEYVEAG